MDTGRDAFCIIAVHDYFLSLFSMEQPGEQGPNSKRQAPEKLQAANHQKPCLERHGR
jgi:hypothetical protein